MRKELGADFRFGAQAAFDALDPPAITGSATAARTTALGDEQLTIGPPGQPKLRPFGR